MDTIKAKSYNGKNGIDAVIHEYNDLSTEIENLNKEIQDLNDLLKTHDDVGYLGFIYEEIVQPIQKDLDTKTKKLNKAKTDQAALEDLKKAYVRLYATFDQFNQDSAKAQNVYYLKITEEQNNPKNGEDNIITGNYVPGQGYAVRTSKLNNFFDAIHTQEGTVRRQFTDPNTQTLMLSANFVNPHITAVPVFGNRAQNKFQAELQKAIFDQI